jgi:hypothetical protein
MSADTRTNDELPDDAQSGDEAALAVLSERHRNTRERIVRLRVGRGCQCSVDPADVVPDTYLEVRNKFPPIPSRPAYAFICEAAPGRRPGLIEEICG